MTGWARLAAGLALAALLGGCAGSTAKRAQDVTWQDLAGPKAGEPKAQPALEVNALLWRASLDTLGFMPIKQANPNTGLIRTGWHAEPTGANERFRLDVRIRTTDLRADGVDVSVFRQTRSSADAAWQQAKVAAATRRGVTDAIIAQARKLRRRLVDAPASKN